MDRIFLHARNQEIDPRNPIAAPGGLQNTAISCAFQVQHRPWDNAMDSPSHAENRGKEYLAGGTGVAVVCFDANCRAINT